MPISPSAGTHAIVGQASQSHSAPGKAPVSSPQLLTASLATTIASSSPIARQSHPTLFSGRRAPIRAPTMANARIGTTNPTLLIA